jgi:hypothetical protein
VATLKRQSVAKTDEHWDELPTLTGVDEILEYINSELRIPLRRYQLSRAIETGKLKTQWRLVGNYHSAAPKDVREWLANAK